MIGAIRRSIGSKSKPRPPAYRAACARSSSLTSMSPVNTRVTDRGSGAPSRVLGAGALDRGAVAVRPDTGALGPGPSPDAARGPPVPVQLASANTVATAAATTLAAAAATALA